MSNCTCVSQSYAYCWRDADWIKIAPAKSASDEMMSFDGSKNGISLHNHRDKLRHLTIVPMQFLSPGDHDCAIFVAPDEIFGRPDLESVQEMLIRSELRASTLRASSADEYISPTLHAWLSTHITFVTYFRYAFLAFVNTFPSKCQYSWRDAISFAISSLGNFIRSR